jgi:multidrug resistance protein
MFAPGLSLVMKEFHSASGSLASFVVSIYILGYAIGPLFMAPLSELYGRLPVYHVSNLLFVIFTVACAVSSNLGMLIAFRFLDGCAGSTPLVLGGGSIADLITQEKRGGVMAIWAMGPLMGPVVGPIAGGYLAQRLGWRWVFWVIAIVVS